MGSVRDDTVFMLHGRGEIERLDAGLAELVRGEAALRLRLGQALEVVSRGAVFELGFSSVGAYALERCERSVRWAEAARCMARRLEGLPALRANIAMGRVSWSMGELLASVARAEDEEKWIELSEGRTVRQMRTMAAEVIASRDAAGGAASTLSAVESCSASEETCTLSCSVTQEDAWLFEATGYLLDQLGAQGADARCEALLAEAQEALLASSPEHALALERALAADTTRERWCSQLERLRAEAEAMCEGNGWLCSNLARAGGKGSKMAMVAAAAACGMGDLEGAPREHLDTVVRGLAQALARHELDVSRLLLMFHRADGWRRLGYATEAQYARERLGASRSSIVARRILALRLERLPGITAALGQGLIGVEAALQIVRVATINTEAAWIERARRRTIKHLREEVAAALTAVRWSDDVDCWPPVDAEMMAFQALEQAVVSGRVLRTPGQAALGEPAAGSSVNGRRLAEPESEQRRAWFVMLRSLASWLEDGVQMSAAPGVASRSSALRVGLVTLRLRMSRATRAWWRALELQALPWLPRGMSWLRFLCLSFWHAWRHSLRGEVAYAHIYARDRYRCTRRHGSDD